ncbi:MAG TPA: AI-2E family transporter, partial [Dongiaceae bacterium]|nr:AI-2E family transporter [Dongiaceae bacterium]
MTQNNELTGSPPRQNRPRVIRIEPSPGTLIALLLLFAGLWVLPRLMPVVLVLVAALTIVGTISPAVRWFEERHIRRGMGIAVAFSLLMVVAVLISTLTIPALMAQATTLLDLEPALRASLAKWMAGSHLTSPLAGLLRKVQSGDLVRM